MALALDRKAFIDIITEGQGDVGGDDAAGAGRRLGDADRDAEDLPGYDPDVAKNRAEARKIMEKLGYGPNKRLAVTVSTRNIPPYRDPAVILIDQLKEIYIDGELEPLDTTQWYPKLIAQGLHGRAQRQRNGGRRPGPAILRELHLRRGAQLHRLLQPRGRQAGRPAIGRSRSDKRKQLVWEIETQAGRGRRPAGDLLPARRQTAAPQVKGLTIMVEQHLQRLALRRPLARPAGGWERTAAAAAR